MEPILPRVTTLQVDKVKYSKLSLYTWLEQLSLQIEFKQFK